MITICSNSEDRPCLKEVVGKSGEVTCLLTFIRCLRKGLKKKKGGELLTNLRVEVERNSSEKFGATSV